jgi:hypothetical protein
VQGEAAEWGVNTLLRRPVFEFARARAYEPPSTHDKPQKKIRIYYHASKESDKV